MISLSLIWCCTHDYYCMLLTFQGYVWDNMPEFTAIKIQFFIFKKPRGCSWLSWFIEVLWNTRIIQLQQWANQDFRQVMDGISEFHLLGWWVGKKGERLVSFLLRSSKNEEEQKKASSAHHEGNIIYKSISLLSISSCSHAWPPSTVLALLLVWGY